MNGDQVKVIQRHTGEANNHCKGARLHGGAVKVNPAPSVLSQHEYADYSYIIFILYIISSVQTFGMLFRQVQKPNPKPK